MNNKIRLDRRGFIKTTSFGAMGTGLGIIVPNLSDTKQISDSDPGVWNPSDPMIRTGKELVIQPLLRHQLEEPKAQTSWRNWGDVHTETDALQEVARITAELDNMKKSADFPIKILPVKRATSDSEGEKVRMEKNYDVMLLYAAGGDNLDPCIPDDRFSLIFIRHISGPMYDFYENASNRFLRKAGKEFEIDTLRYYNGVGPDDVIVDDYEEMLWKLKALYGIHNFLGKKIIALGGAGGKMTSMAPELARTKYNLEIVEISYDDLEKRLNSYIKDPAMGKKVLAAMGEYLKIPSTKVLTTSEFIRKSFYNYYAFKDFMSEHNSTAFTINSCMRAIMPISQSTACLPLSLLNDEGYLAFCESDFVVIPSGILLHYISQRPVFLHNPTYPQKNIVMCAHCTAPRRMDGNFYEPADIVTHYESDFGAALKAYYKINQRVTLIDPDAAQKRWLGMEGVVSANPSLAACRSQQEINFIGDTDILKKEIRGSHWMMAYGSWTREVGYATRKLGMDWLNISDKNKYYESRKYI